MERSEKLMRAQETYDQVKLEDDIDKIIEVYNNSPDHKQTVSNIYYVYNDTEKITIYFKDKEEEEKKN